MSNLEVMNISTIAIHKQISYNKHYEDLVAILLVTENNGTLQNY